MEFKSELRVNTIKSPVQIHQTPTIHIIDLKMSELMILLENESSFCWFFLQIFGGTKILNYCTVSYFKIFKKEILAVGLSTKSENQTSVQIQALR